MGSERGRAEMVQYKEAVKKVFLLKLKDHRDCRVIAAKTNAAKIIRPKILRHTERQVLIRITLMKSTNSFYPLEDADDYGSDVGNDKQLVDAQILIWII